MLSNLKITASDIQAELNRRQQEKQRYKARTDLFYLLTVVLGRKDIEREWLEARCREVQESPDGYLDLWAREHYKSTIITYALSIQDIIRSHGDGALEEQECTIGIFSHTRPAAKGFLRQIKMELENNQRLKDLFPDIFWQEPKKQASKWSEDDGIIVKRRTNPKEATIEAWGVVDGQPTGKHFTVLVYDDVVTKESVTTPEQIKNTTDSLVLSYNLGANGGRRRFIGTRYHFNDSYREIISRGTVIPRIYPATHDGTVDGDPVLLTAEQLTQKRRDMGAYIFSCQMLQNPVADGVQGFPEGAIQFYDNPETVKGNTYILMDPANAKKKSSDYTAGWVITLGQDQNIYIRDGIRDRLNLKERTTQLFDWHRKFKPMRDHGVRYERYGKDADIEHILSKQEDETYRFNITEVGGSTSKNDRIKRLLPYFEQKRIFMPRTMHRTDYQKVVYDLTQIFINEEYKAFPVPIHDDMLDALARILEPDYPPVWPDLRKVDNSTEYDYGGVAGEGAWMA